MANIPAYTTDDFEIPGAPDAFQRLWTPHRRAYVGGGQKDYNQSTCPFCDAPQHSDADSLIIARGEHAYAILNLYPYNPGHVLVCPYRHIPNYDDASPAETAEIADLTQQCMRMMREVSHAHGFNIGMNQGKVGGAGIAAHLHQHIVPRWDGDTNFLPLIAGTKTVTQTLGEIRELFADSWERFS